jgi:diguanylate cyclase (GGDEF)-like protein
VGLDGIKHQILAFAVLATLIPAVTTAWISYVQNKRSLTEKVTEELANAGSQAARELDLWSKERLYELRVFAASYEVSENLERWQRGGVARTAARGRLGDYLQSVQVRFADYHELLVTDAGGRPVATSRDTAGPVNLGDDWLRRIRTEEALLGDPKREVDGETRLALAVPIVGASGAFLGAMVARVNLRAAGDLLEGLTQGSVTLVDRAGEPIPATGAPLTAVPPDALTRLREAAGRVVEYRGETGDRMVGSLVDVPRLSWSVVVAIPRSDAYAPIARLRNVTILTLTALLAVVGVIAYGMGLHLVRPLDRLTQGAGRVAGGDLDVDLPVASYGEIGYLTRVFNDMVRRLRESRQELERLTLTDGLTGLANRRHLMATLEAELQRSQRHKHPCSALMMDVDKFKQYNDTYGHLAGDDVLVRMGVVLRETLRTVDHAARYGGEEFAVILPETDLEGALEVGERIRERLAKEAFVPDPQGPPVAVTVSIGVAEFPRDGEKAEALLNAADGALYQAKKKGRDRVVATDQKRVRASQRVKKVSISEVDAR